MPIRYRSVWISVLVGALLALLVALDDLMRSRPSAADTSDVAVPNPTSKVVGFNGLAGLPFVGTSSTELVPYVDPLGVSTNPAYASSTPVGTLDLNFRNILPSIRLGNATQRAPTTEIKKSDDVQQPNPNWKWFLAVILVLVLLYLLVSWFGDETDVSRSSQPPPATRTRVVRPQVINEAMWQRIQEISLATGTPIPSVRPKTRSEYSLLMRNTFDPSARLPIRLRGRDVPLAEAIQRGEWIPGSRQ